MVKWVQTIQSDLYCRDSNSFFGFQMFFYKEKFIRFPCVSNAFSIGQLQAVIYLAHVFISFDSSIGLHFRKSMEYLREEYEELYKSNQNERRQKKMKRKNRHEMVRQVMENYGHISCDAIMQ